MIRVVLIGGGNLVYQLSYNLLKNSEVDLIQVINRSLDSIRYLENKTEITNKLSDIQDADIYMIAVSDNAIADVAEKLNVTGKLVVHTSGAIPLEILPENCMNGVFYLPQTFSKGKKLDLSVIPICIEASSPEGYQLLHKFANTISNNIYELDYKQRCHLHAAAVFANNFVNHIYHHSKEICENGNVDFEILHPLIQETAKKIVGLNPIEIQTGPARRNDIITLEKHKKILGKDQIELYTFLTKSIMKTYEKKL